MTTTPHPTPTNIPPDHLTGAELQTLREAAGLSREALAQLVGVEARTVKHWENGRAGVPADVAQVARTAADWVATMAHRVRMAGRRTHHGRPERLASLQIAGNAEPEYLQIEPAITAAPVVLMRYRETAHMHPNEAQGGGFAELHGAAIAQAVQGLTLDGVRARVVWFEPEAYSAWVDAQRLADTPEARQHWAEGQGLAAQAIPPRGDQPPPGFAPGYGSPSTGTTRTRSRP